VRRGPDQETRMSLHQTPFPAGTPHGNRRVRHELRFRMLHVLRSETVSPHMRRIVLGGPVLAGFASPAPDDHVKLFFANADGQFVLPEMTPEGPRYPQGALPSPSRDYTPRWFDAQAGELAIDFVLHGEGIACEWARRAQPGDALGVGGPRGSLLVAENYRHLLLLGDETALPAIARWLEEMPRHWTADVFVEIPDEDERQPLAVREGVDVRWLERNGVPAATSGLLEETLRDWEPPEGEGDTYAWIACESRRARMMRKFVEGHLGVPSADIRATGYWSAAPDGHEG
jgi:NADPH-dependent ferric siderophore reductase